VPRERVPRIRFRTIAPGKVSQSFQDGGERKQLHTLTGLRFGAALMVVLYHVIADGAGQRSPGLDLRTIFMNMMNSGYAGVSFFFILSGFILTYTYMARRPLTGERRWNFWVARIARIYPVYLVGILFAAYPYIAPSMVSGRVPWTSKTTVGLLASLGLVRSWLPYYAYAWDGPGWSLSAEAFFYLMFPLISLWLIRLKPRQLLIAVAGFWALIALPVAAYVVFQPDGQILPHSPTVLRAFWMLVVYTLPLIRLPEFLLGIALGRLFLLRRPQVKADTGYLPVLGTVVALIGIFVVFAYGPLTPVLWNDVILDPLFALLIFTSAWGQGAIARFFSLPFLVLLGEASYALYLIHVPLWGMAGTVFNALDLYTYPAQYSLGVMAYLVIAVGLSVLIFRFIEEPARKGIRLAYDSLQARFARARFAASEIAYPVSRLPGQERRSAVTRPRPHVRPRD
jgi:peptidoglycan/LPS O-acetylase OafA/YrhL